MTIAPLTRILYFEDEPDIRTIAELSLESEGVTVQFSENGVDAVEKAKTFKPELILLDVMMPVVDGPATLKALKADPATREIPIIFMTAKTQASEIESYVALGALGVISKPFDPMTLYSSVVDYWKKRHG